MKMPEGFGSKWQHYKGGIYTWICSAFLESDRKTVVIIYMAEDGSIWSRPLKEFAERVEVPTPNGFGYVKRFTEIETAY